MSEQNYKQCKVCKELKLRIQEGTFGDGQSKRWLGDDGKLWNGRTCPQCVVIKSRENMAIKRAYNKVVSNYGNALKNLKD